MNTPYTLTITADDVEAIHHAGDRYGWSISLIALGLDEEGVHNISENYAWDIVESLEENGMIFCVPLLSEQSNLYAELSRLWDEVV
jgi:hypothetical protein